MKVDFQKDSLTIFLEGRIDSNNAAETEEQITGLVSRNPDGSKVIIDAENLEYISSAGLRVLLKVRKQLNKPLPVINVSNEVYETFSVTGFTELLDVHKKMREISLEGCELLGEGGNGEVYRLTKDEMIKLYKYGVSLDSVEAEREASRKAFLLGVPCAIAFDTVKCGDSYGTIFEMFNAGTLSERIIENHERLPEFAKASAILLKQLHSIEIPEGQMPKASRLIHNTIDKMYPAFSADEIEKMHALYNTIPEQNHFIHNDYHPKNIMESNGELMLIDLGDAGMGNPVIDLIHSYFVMNSVGEAQRRSDDDVGFFGLTYRDMREFWEILIDTYFEGDKEKIKSVEEKLKPFAEFMHLTAALTHPLMRDSKYKEIYTNELRNEILPRFDELVKFTWEM